MRKFFLAAILVLVASGAQAATIDLIEAAGGGTYLDFEFDIGGATGSSTDGVFVRNGLTATGTGSGWGYPDGSLSGLGIDGINITGMDTKANPHPEFRIDLAGLTAPSYEVHVVAQGNSEAVQDWGFQWGTASGSLTNVEDIATTLGRITVLGSNEVVTLDRIPIGSFTPNDSSLTFFFDNNTGNGPHTRTLLDGIVVVPIPEPSTALLLGLGLVGMAARRRV
jgi:hypothetical protein